MLVRTGALLAIAAVLAASCGARQTSESLRPAAATVRPTTPAALADVIRSGKIRVAFNRQNIACFQWYQGPISGPCVDIALELTEQMRVQIDDRQYDSIDLVFDAGRRDEWDVAFTAIEGGRSGFAFTPAYLEIENTYLVPGGSPFTSVVDVDRPGVRVAVFSPSAIERYLRQNLTNATLVPLMAGGISAAAALIERGQVDAYAGSRDELVKGGYRLAGGRVLADSITRTQWGIAVASGRTDLLAYVSRFVDSAKNAGVVQEAIDRNDLKGARRVIALG